MRSAAASGTGPPTIRDVAALAGVSVTTVSRVLNSAPKVSSDARARVTAAVERLDFVTSPAARALRPGTTSRTWGLLVDEVTSFYFGRLVEELDRVGQERGCTLLVSTTHKLLDRERRLSREMALRRVDGLFIVPASGDRSTLPQRDSGLPTVYLDRFPFGTVADVVTFDYYQAVADQVDDLWQRGHRRIAFIGGEVREDPGARRFAAYRDSLTLHGVPLHSELVSTGHVDGHTASAVAAGLLDRPDPPTAIVTTTGAVTLDILRAVQDRVSTVELPPDLEIVGSEDFGSAFLSPVPLSLVVADLGDLAKVATDLLIGRIEGTLSGDPVTRSLPTTVVRHHAHLGRTHP